MTKTKHNNIKKATAFNPVDIYVGNKVRFFRKITGLNQTELAQRLGLTFQQIQKYEKGENRISASRLYDITKIFNIPIDSLFPEKEEDIKVKYIYKQTYDLAKNYMNTLNEDERKLVDRLVEGLISNKG